MGKLNFRRTFVLTSEAIESPTDWKCTPIREYHLYAHPDLAISLLNVRGRDLVLIGEIYDPKEPVRGNEEILRELAGGEESLDDCIMQLAQYAGCFAFLHITEHGSSILHDARGLREIYYSTGINRVICASQPHLVAMFAEPALEKTNDEELQAYFAGKLWDSRWVGDETMFAGIKHLLPNHLLNIDSREIRRYWPNKRVEKLTLEEAVSQTSAFLEGMLKAIVARQPAMMAVTAGEDSRVLLAASKEVQDSIYYFVNDNMLGSKHPDISVPCQIFNSLGAPFHVHMIKNDVDGEFRRTFFNNTFLANERMLSSVSHLHEKGLGQKVSILGVSEIGRTFFGVAPKPLTGKFLSYKIGYPDCPYVKRQCDRMVNEMQAVSDRYGINVMALFYWEQRLGNWGATRNSESLLGYEKIDPFNSHSVYETYLGVDEKHRDYQNVPCVFSTELIRSMWPQLLDWPINPVFGTRDRIKWFLSKFHLLELLRSIKFQMSKFRQAIKGSSSKG